MIDPVVVCVLSAACILSLFLAANIAAIRESRRLRVA